MEKRYEILREQLFPTMNMGTEERDFLLQLLYNCKDIMDSENGNIRYGNVIEFRMNKEKDNLIKISGSVSYDSECRTISGYIYYDNNNIIFDTQINRLCVNEGRKKYSVLDIFEPIQFGYKRISNYNYDDKKYIEDIMMKGNVNYGKN